MDYPEHFTQRYPFALWAYLVLLGLFFIDARVFAATTTSPKLANAIIFGLLILGLFAGSRVCRWALIALSLATALSILLIEAGSGNLADASLVIIPLGQVGVLSSPRMRAFTAARANRAT